MTTIRTVCAHDCPDQCSLIATVEDGRVVRVQGDPDHPMTAGFACAKVNREHELVHSPDRIRTPLRRTGTKGAAEFAPITWDEALDEIETRWKAIIHGDGPLAILGYAYSAHQGVFNRGLVLGFFHALGSSRLKPGTVCDTCAYDAWDSVAGDVGGNDPESVVDSDLVISWGADLLTTNVHMWPLVEAARHRGATLIVIEPRRSGTAERADWHVRVNVGTDAALALGMMHVLAREGLVDREYVARQTLGFDRLERDVLPRFAPSRVAEITGVATADVERLAWLYGGARAPFIRLGQGMTRLAQGGQAMRAVSLLPGVVGAYAKRGGGAVLGTASTFGFDLAAIRKPSGPATTREVNHSRLGEALLTMKDPLIRALYVAANNPAVTCPDSHAVRRGLARDDLFTVVHDPFLTDTARYADLVLPATTYLETEDFHRSYGSYYMQRAAQVVAPQGEARSSRFMAQELARRMGVRDTVFSMSTDELIATIFRNARGPVTSIDPATLRDHRPVKLPLPDGGPRWATPSGRLEFYSEVLAAQGLAPMPDWTPDPVEERDAARWPLRLLTAPGYYQSHTAFSGNETLRRRAGAPECVLHPDDATRRGLADGDAVMLVNDRGEVRMRLRVSDEVGPGVVLVSGQRPAGEGAGTTINMLCSTRYSDIGEGATYQSTWLDVRRSFPVESRG